MKTFQIIMDETEKEIKNIKLLLEKKNDEIDIKKKDIDNKKKDIDNKKKDIDKKKKEIERDRLFLRLDDELKRLTEIELRSLETENDKLLSVIIEEKQLNLLMEKALANPNENLPKRVKKDNQE
ncbi:hypothetical protein HDU92_008974, partial [Lobulomyces angularis]